MILLLVSVAALVLSLAVSWAAEGMMNPIVLIPGFLMLRLSQNPGIAFSIHIPSPWKEVLILSALVAVCIVAVRSHPTNRMSASFGLIIGGALSNLLDRIPDGFVTDYISVGTFPVFNVADSCITIGAALLLIDAFRTRHASESALKQV